MGAESPKASIHFVKSVRLFVCNSTDPIWRISVKFGIWDLDENLSNNHIWLNSSTSHVTPKYILLLPATLHRHKTALRMKLFQAFRIDKEIKTLSERATALRKTKICTYVSICFIMAD